MQPVVYKFSLYPVVDVHEIEMPPVIALLHYGWQNGIPMLWALVDATEGAPKSKRRFYLRGTGHAVPNEPLHHVGSAVSHGDGLVTHLFAARVDPDHESRVAAAVRRTATRDADVLEGLKNS